MQILRNLASIFLMSRSRLDLHQALLANSFRKRRELQFFSTRNAANAFITILSSRVILPIKMQKQVVIPKDIILKAKANKYQRNQTILP